MTQGRSPLGLALFLMVALGGCGDGPADPVAASAGLNSESHDDSLERRRTRYVQARTGARAWLDRLDVDAVHLVASEVKGIKKLGEALSAYQVLSQHPLDEEELAVVTRRVAQLTEQTKSDRYHALMQENDVIFDQNSMSYLRVMHLMNRLGLDTARYRERLSEIRPRMDVRLRHRQPWERKAFLRYYDHFGLGKPSSDGESWEVPSLRHLPLEEVGIAEAYEVTHEAYVAFDYGLDKRPRGLSEKDAEYLRQVSPVLLWRSINGGLIDLAAEVVSSMTYLGLAEHPSYVRGIDYLLDTQNETGSWGDYEHWRPTMGDHVDQRLYLHTTSVSVRALIEAFDGDWPVHRASTPPTR